MRRDIAGSIHARDMKLKKALLIVDVQNDFCPGGKLAVPEGDKVVPVLNRCVKLFTARQLPVFASRDWHPKVTKHFKKYGGQWPLHCVQNTKGAAFHPKLRLPKEAVIFSKGMDPGRDSYSVFHAADEYGRGFADTLKMFGVTALYIGGLATDYCVKFSALDALRQGVRAIILTDAVRGVNLNPGDTCAALDEMKAAGARLVAAKEIRV